MQKQPKTKSLGFAITLANITSLRNCSVIDKVDPTTGFYVQHYACLHKYTQWGSSLCEAPVFCNFFKRFKKNKHSFTHLFCEKFLHIFSCQWPLFTAPSPPSHMWISVFMENCLGGGCLQAAAFLESQADWRRASAVYIYCTYGRFTLQTQGQERLFFF